MDGCTQKFLDQGYQTVTIDGKEWCYNPGGSTLPPVVTTAPWTWPTSTPFTSPALPIATGLAFAGSLGGGGSRSAVSSSTPGDPGWLFVHNKAYVGCRAEVITVTTQDPQGITEGWFLRRGAVKDTPIGRRGFYEGSYTSAWLMYREVRATGQVFCGPGIGIFKAIPSQPPVSF